MSLLQEIRLAPDDQTLLELTTGPPDVTFIITNISPDAPPPNRPQTVALHLHKALLKKVSGFYDRLFSISMRESRENTFTFYYLNPNVYRLILESIYGDTIRTADWRMLFEILILLRFLAITRVDPTEILRGIYINPNELVEYLQRLLILYPDEVPVELIELAARLLKSEIDLTLIPDEVVEVLLSSELYQPPDEMLTYRMIDRLVRGGRDPDLYRFVRFRSIPAPIRMLLPQNIVEKYSTPLRRLSAEEKFLPPSLYVRSLRPLVSPNEPVNVKVVEAPSTSSFTGERQIYIRGQKGSPQVRAVLLGEPSQPIHVGDVIRLIQYSYREDPGFHFEISKYEPF